jgi:hypothetical protein
MPLKSPDRHPSAGTAPLAIRSSGSATRLSGVGAWQRATTSWRPSIVPKRLQLPAQMMRADAGFHTDQMAWRPQRRGVRFH